MPWRPAVGMCADTPTPRRKGRRSSSRRTTPRRSSPGRVPLDARRGGPHLLPVRRHGQRSEGPGRHWRNSGTTYRVPYLPPGRTLHARVSTKLLDGSGCRRMCPSRRREAGRHVLHPDGATKVNLNEPYRWTESGAQAYTLTVGTRPGASDLLETGEIHESRYVVRSCRRTEPSTPASPRSAPTDRG